MYMKQRFIYLLQDPFVSQMAKFFLGVLLIYLFLGVWKWKNLPPELPLFYSIPRGKEQLGTPFLLLLLPFFSFFFFIGNLLWASLLLEKERLAACILVTIGTITSCLFLITFIKIVFLIS